MMGGAQSDRAVRVDRAADGGEWGDIVAEAVYPLLPLRPAPGFTGSIRHIALPAGIRVGEVRTDPVTLLRTARLVARAPSDDLLLLLHLDGASSVSQSGRDLRLRAGDATLLDPTREYRVASDARSRQMVIVVPRAVTHRLASPVEAIQARAVGHGSVAVRALAAMVSASLAADAPSDEHDAEGLAGAVRTLVVSILAGSAGTVRDDSPEAVAARAREYVRDHLADSDLSPERIASALAVSGRRLSQVLAGDESPASLIRRERLRAAHRELSSAGFDGYAVGQIGMRWGFADATTFTRAFVREHGVTPSSVRRGRARRADVPIEPRR